jgi:hypothetical protein
METCGYIDNANYKKHEKIRAQVTHTTALLPQLPNIGLVPFS